MNIGRKLTFWIILVVFVIGLLSTYFFLQMEIVNETARLESLGNIVGRIVEKSLDNYMMIRDFTVLDKTLRDLRDMKSISSISLINREGIVKISTDAHAVGKKMVRNGPGCTGCHETGKNGLYFKKEKIFRWVQPIRNKPECFRCHSASIRNNGIFVIEFSLYEWEKEVKNEALMGFSILIPSLAVIGFVMLYLSKNLVIRRLSMINTGVKNFREGHYDIRIPSERNDDEITELERGFNEMAEAIGARDSEKDDLLDKVSRSEKMWQETFDSIGDMISIHDRDFNIIKVNRAFARYFGLDPAAVVHKKCYEFFHAGDSPSAKCPHVMTLKEDRPFTGEFPDTKTGRIFLVSTFPFHVQNAEFHGSIHIAKDITEEREKEMRLIMTERLASLGQMASGIAHEINNPLAAIAGCAEGLLNRVEKGRYDPELFRNYLMIVEEEILRCKSITSSMLSFVRETTYEKKMISINEMLDKALEIIGFQGRLREVKVLNDYIADTPLVHGSEGELRQVFLSIITNALDAMNNKGTLTIKTGTEGNTVFIKIGDTGPGIPPANINRIFDPFFTSKSATGGTGLGLSIASKIISNHKGKIDVTSQEDKGTVFRISLPLPGSDDGESAKEDL